MAQEEAEEPETNQKALEPNEGVDDLSFRVGRRMDKRKWTILHYRPSKAGEKKNSFQERKEEIHSFQRSLYFNWCLCGQQTAGHERIK